MKMICWRFYIKTPSTFWDMRTWDMSKVCLRTFRNNRICYKIACFLRNLQTSRTNNWIILKIENAKFSGYFFYMNANIERDFQIRISVPLSCFYCGTITIQLNYQYLRAFWMLTSSRFPQWKRKFMTSVKNCLKQIIWTP